MGLGYIGTQIAIVLVVAYPRRIVLKSDAEMILRAER